MSDIKISIVGGGLSAIYSYFGALDAGFSSQEIEILKMDSPTPVGAVFMYDSIIPWPPITVTSILLGTAAQYARNQWGAGVVLTSAHSRFLESNYVQEQLYDPAELLPTLWGMVENLRTLRQTFDYAKILNLAASRKAVICTFANSSTKLEYFQKGYVKNIPIYILEKYPEEITPNYTVIYNGQKSVPWVRQTTMNGKISVEYPHDHARGSIIFYEEARGHSHGKVVEVPDLVPNCPAVPVKDRVEGNILRVGRMATFDRKYLSHQARSDVKEFLEKL